MSKQRENIIEAAKEFAAFKHRTQKRKYTGEPYFVHLIGVAALVNSVVDDKTTDGQNMIAAAYLHDTMEDTDTTYPELCNEFNVDVADLVGWLTDRSKPWDGNREKRKEIDRNILARAPKRAKTIKLADLIDNTSTIVKYDPGFAKVYLHEKELLLYALDGGDDALMIKAWDTLNAGLAELEKYFSNCNSFHLNKLA